MDEIRVVDPGKTSGYPYLVCKKIQSNLLVWSPLLRDHLS